MKITSFNRIWALIYIMIGVVLGMSYNMITLQITFCTLGICRLIIGNDQK